MYCQILALIYLQRVYVKVFSDEIICLIYSLMGNIRRICLKALHPSSVANYKVKKDIHMTKRTILFCSQTVISLHE